MNRPHSTLIATLRAICDQLLAEIASLERGDVPQQFNAQQMLMAQQQRSAYQPQGTQYCRDFTAAKSDAQGGRL